MAQQVAQLGPYQGDKAALVAACICMGITDNTAQVMRAQRIVEVLKSKLGSQVDDVLDQAVAFAATGQFGEPLGTPRPRATGSPQFVQTVFTQNELAVIYIMALIVGCTLVSVEAAENPILTLMMGFKVETLRRRYAAHSREDIDSALNKLLKVQV